MGLKIIAAVILGYLIGSVNTAVIVGKLKGIDITKKGSGNAGATNSLRTMGKAAGLVVLLGDLLKGVVSVLLGMLISGDYGIAAGLSCVVGHNFPVYFGFKGGKGVVTTLAVAFFIDWRIALALLILAIVIIIVTKYVSLASVSAMFLFPFVLWFSDASIYKIIIGALLAALSIARHKENIKRLLNKKESKISFSKKTDTEA